MAKTQKNGPPFNYLSGLINAIAVFFLVWLLWYVFMNPNTVLKLYTPMYGFALVVTFVASILIINTIADFYPFQDSRIGSIACGKGDLSDGHRHRAHAVCILRHFLGIYRQIRGGLFQSAVHYRGRRRRCGIFCGHGKMPVRPSCII